MEFPLFLYFHVYVFTVISMISDICSSVISFFFKFVYVMVQFHCAVVLLNYIVTLVRLSLVTNKGYLLTYLLTINKL